MLFANPESFAKLSLEPGYRNRIRRPVGEYSTTWSIALEESKYSFLLFCLVLLGEAEANLQIFQLVLKLSLSFFIYGRVFSYSRKNYALKAAVEEKVLVKAFICCFFILQQMIALQKL